MPQLPLTNLHRWDVGPDEAVAIQHTLAGRVSLVPDFGEVRLVAGVDTSTKDVARAAVVLLSYPELQVLEVARAEKPLDFPYIPGLLSFREGPAILAAFEKISRWPDLAFFDGQGLAHPRKIGIASHINIALFEKQEVEFIICDCAACGAQTKEYAELLTDDPQWAERAARFSEKVRDIMEFLGEIPLNEPKGVVASRVAYHEACHLCHAQKVRNEPVEVLSRVPGVQLEPLAESDTCCGSAGVYNLTHNERSMLILDRKMENIEATEANVVLAGNPGCMLQLDYGRRKVRSRKPVVHPVQLVDAAYREAHWVVQSPGTFHGIDSGEALRSRGGRVLIVAANGKRISITDNRRRGDKRGRVKSEERPN